MVLNLPPKVRQKTFWGIFMESNRKRRKYDLSIKLKAVEFYESGYGSNTISSLLDAEHSMVKRWLSSYRAKGASCFKKQTFSHYTEAFKRSVVCSVLDNNLSLDSVALQYGISRSAVQRWVFNVRERGMESLVRIKPRGRPPKAMGRPKKQKPQSELEQLQEKIARLEAENALLKKVQALVEQRETQQQKSGFKPSKN